MTPLFYKDNVPNVDIKMTVYKGMSNVKEDFRGASIWVWILNPLRCKIPFSVTLQTDGTLVGKMPTNLPEGVYGIKILWTKDHEHKEGVCYKMHDRYMCAEVADVFAITDDEVTESGEIISDDATINVKFHSATYGRDGLDAYEKAFMIGKTNLSEEAWIDKYVKEIATHAQLQANINEVNNRHNDIEAEIVNELGELSDKNDSQDAVITTLDNRITQEASERETLEGDFETYKEYVEGTLGDKVDKVQGKGLSSNDFLDSDLIAVRSTVPGLRVATQTLSTNLSTLDDALAEYVTEFGEIIEEHDAAFAEIHTNAKTKRLQINDSTGAEAGHIDVTETGTLEIKSEANRKVHIEGDDLDIDSLGTSHYYVNGDLMMHSLTATDITAGSNVNIFTGNKFRVHSSTIDTDANVILSTSGDGVYVDGVPFIVRNNDGQLMSVSDNELKMRLSDTLSIAVQAGNKNRVNIVAPEIRWIEKRTTDAGEVDVEHKFTEVIKEVEKAGKVIYRNRSYDDYPIINVAEEKEVFYDYGTQYQLGLTGTDTKSPYKKVVVFDTEGLTEYELEAVLCNSIPIGADFIGDAELHVNSKYMLTILCGVYRLEEIVKYFGM